MFGWQLLSERHVDLDDKVNYSWDTILESKPPVVQVVVDSGRQAVFILSIETLRLLNITPHTDPYFPAIYSWR